jgi:hypothetical protein
MKTKFFRKFAMTVLLLWPVVLSAQNGISISNFSVTPGSSTTLTFDVSWSTAGMEPGFVWSDTAWVFVDYNNAGTMTRLPLKSATASAGTVTKLDGNDKGVWVAGNARPEGSFSATVRLVTNKPTADLGGLCVYALNYPPVGEYTAANKIKFTGTPPYYLTYISGNGATITRSEAIDEVPLAQPLASFTDASAAPGVFSCLLPEMKALIALSPGYCEGSEGVTFAMDGTESGVTYQLIKDNAEVVATLSGTGNPEEFTGAHPVGTYTARSVGTDMFCEMAMYGQRVVTEYPLPAAPTISSAGTACASYTLTATPGDGGAGILWDDGSRESPRTVAAAGTYSCKSETEAGCTSIISATIAIDSLPNFDAPSSSPCAPSYSCLDCPPCDEKCQSLTTGTMYAYAPTPANDYCAVLHYCATHDCTDISALIAWHRTWGDGYINCVFKCVDARCYQIQWADWTGKYFYFSVQ